MLDMSRQYRVVASRYEKVNLGTGPHKSGVSHDSANHVLGLSALLDKGLYICTDVQYRRNVRLGVGIGG